MCLLGDVSTFVTIVKLYRLMNDGCKVKSTKRQACIACLRKRSRSLNVAQEYQRLLHRRTIQMSFLCYIAYACFHISYNRKPK